MPPDFALRLTLISSNYPCLELIFIVPKVFQPLKFDCITGWSGGAMVLGKLPVPGRPTNLDCSRARAYCACSRCGLGLFGHFFFRLSILFCFSLSLGDGPYRLNYCLKGPLSPKQPTNQPKIDYIRIHYHR